MLSKYLFSERSIREGMLGRWIGESGHLFVGGLQLIQMKKKAETAGTGLECYRLAGYMELWSPTRDQAVEYEHRCSSAVGGNWEG